MLALRDQGSWARSVVKVIASVALAAGTEMFQRICRLAQRHKTARQAPKAGPPPGPCSRGLAACNGPAPSRLSKAAGPHTPNSIMAQVAEQTQQQQIDDDAVDPLDCPDYYWSD